MYTLYIANKIYSSWSLRPWVLMRTLSIAFEEKIFPFATGSNRDAYRVFSPSGRVPCLHHGEMVIWDSMAIAEYLAEQHPGIWPDDRVARTWARSATAEMHSGFAALRQQCPMHCGFRIALNPVTPALQQDIERVDALWREGLQRFGGPFLAGAAFTAVDAFFAPVVFRVQSYGLPLSETALAYAQRILALKAMREWETAALLEPWREPDHEQQALDAGSVLADLRTQ